MKLSEVLSISEVLKVAVHPEHATRLKYIDEEDFTGVCKKVSEYLAIVGYKTSENFYERGVLALKQYYAVALLDPANAHAVSRTLDPFWHFHLLHSESYSAFCQRIVGEYMHHRPLDRSNEEQVKAIRRLYEYTYETISKIFRFADPEFWPAIVSDADLICMHKGNQLIYREIQRYRLFEPTARGSGFDL